MVDIENRLIGKQTLIKYHVLADPRPIDQLKYPMREANCQRAVQQALYELFGEVVSPDLALSAESFLHWGEFVFDPDSVSVMFSIRRLKKDRTPILSEPVFDPRKFHLSLNLGSAKSELVKTAFPNVSDFYKEDEPLIYDANFFRGTTGVMRVSDFKFYYCLVALKTKPVVRNGHLNPPVTLTLDNKSRFSSTLPQPLTTVVNGSSAI